MRPSPTLNIHARVQKKTGASPWAVRSRSHSPVRPSLIGPLSKIRTERDLQGRSVSKHRQPPFRGPMKLVLVIAVALVTLIVFHLSWQGDGPKLVKGDAALAPGDRLKGGQYVSFCTSILTNPPGCRPKYLLMGRDGSLGLYEGTMSPKAKKLWSAEMASKGNPKSEYEMVYTGSKLFLIKDGKMRWMTPVKSLPKDLKPWPFGP